MLYIFIAAVLPALVMVYFIYRKDIYEREPAGQIWKGFGFGALSAIGSLFISVPLMLLGIFSEDPVTVMDNIRLAVFGAAIPEELAKFFFLWLLLRRNRHYNEYVDGIVYSVCIGMGFAAFENIKYLIINYSNWLSVGIARALFAVPGHFFFAVMMGYFYSKASFGNPAKRKQNITLAILVPMALHALYDAILMVSNAVGAAGASIVLVLGLLFFLAKTSKKRFGDHLAADANERVGEIVFPDATADADISDTSNQYGSSE